MEKYEACIAACQECLIDCQRCLHAMAGMESKNDCPKCCALCIDACLASIKFMVAGNLFAAEYCGICADVCQWCAEQCGQHEHEHCVRCANSCVKCMEECRAIAQA